MGKETKEIVEEMERPRKRVEEIMGENNPPSSDDELVELFTKALSTALKEDIDNGVYNGKPNVFVKVRFWFRRYIHAIKAFFKKSYTEQWLKK